MKCSHKLVSTKHIKSIHWWIGSGAQHELRKAGSGHHMHTCGRLYVHGSVLPAASITLLGLFFTNSFLKTHPLNQQAHTCKLRKHSLCLSPTISPQSTSKSLSPIKKLSLEKSIFTRNLFCSTYTEMFLCYFCKNPENHRVYSGVQKDISIQFCPMIHWESNRIHNLRSISLVVIQLFCLLNCEL